MKVSELIKSLTLMQEDYGDINVTITTSNEGKNK